MQTSTPRWSSDAATASSRQCNNSLVPSREKPVRPGLKTATLIDLAAAAGATDVRATLASDTPPAKGDIMSSRALNGMLLTSGTASLCTKCTQSSQHCSNGSNIKLLDKAKPFGLIGRVTSRAVKSLRAARPSKFFGDDANQECNKERSRSTLEPMVA